MQKVDLASDGHSHIKANSEQYLKYSFDLQLKLFTVFDADQPWPFVQNVEPNCAENC